MQRMIGALGLAFAMLAGSAATAAPCVGFTDVDSASGFCANVEWVKNRSITLGANCPPTVAPSYCPGDPVSRLQMAAFMNRLGNALEPKFVHVGQGTASATVNAQGVVCQTPPYPVAGYPRVATATMTLYHTAASTADIAAQAVYSVNGGTTWQPFGVLYSYAANVAGEYVSQSPVAAPLYLSPGDNVIFGIATLKWNGINTTDAGCELTVRIDSHTGAFSPYDTVPEALSTSFFRASAYAGRPANTE